MNATVTTYGLYLIIALPLTVWVARNLFRNGRIFLVDCFHGNESLADSVNQLLVMGFYLINFGFVALYLKLADEVQEVRGRYEAALEMLGEREEAVAELRQDVREWRGMYRDLVEVKVGRAAEEDDEKGN